MDVRKFSREISGVNLWMKVSISHENPLERIKSTRYYDLWDIHVSHYWKRKFLLKILESNLCDEDFHEFMLPNSKPTIAKISWKIRKKNFFVAVLDGRREATRRRKRNKKNKNFLHFECAYYNNCEKLWIFFLVKIMQIY